MDDEQQEGPRQEQEEEGSRPRSHNREMENSLQNHLLNGASQARARNGHCRSLPGAPPQTNQPPQAPPCLRFPPQNAQPLRTLQGPKGGAMVRHDLKSRELDGTTTKGHRRTCRQSRRTRHEVSHDVAGQKASLGQDCAFQKRFWVAVGF